ncbi:MAG: hypothetical protein ABH860_01820 [bacterium]
MKKFLLLICAFAFLLLPFDFAFAAEMKFGSLNVFSKVPVAKIYVDGKVEGTDSAQIKEIQAGTHFLKVTSGEATAEAVLYAELVEIKPGEVTTIYVTEKGLEGQKRGPAEEQVDVFKTKRVIDYSKEMHTGWYIKPAYESALYYNLDSPSLDYYASSFGLGLGFRLPIAPGLDFSLEMERSQLTSSKATWYFMPITANIQISYLPSPYFRGKQFFGLGLGYYMTDLETALKQNLTALGYHLFYGLEMPAGDKNSIFFQFGYHAADLTRYNYTLNGAYASVGYRWDVLE